MINEDEIFMKEAIRQARIAATKDEVPVGAVIVHERRIIAKAYNQIEMLKDPTAHAEMIAITQATNTLSSKWLQDCSLYVTIEPCSMCAGALVLARMGKIFYGASEPKTGACGSVVNIANHQALNHRVDIMTGILAEECSSVLSDFFQQKRKEKKILEN
jgi:tRNA(adenine34) deaminase